MTVGKSMNVYCRDINNLQKVMRKENVFHISIEHFSLH
jgi:hypothetical protein